MELAELKSLIPGLNEKKHAEKICLFGWFLHQHLGKAHFQPSDIAVCYDKLHFTLPSSFSGYFQNLVRHEYLIRNASGYRLSAQIRDRFAAEYKPTGYKVQVTKLLRDLPASLPNLAERTYLDETLICYENGAFRATVVMAWNLAYHHLCDHVVNNRLADFNNTWQTTRKGDHKNGARVIATMDDINQELKESVFIEICKNANIITKDVWKIMDQKLGKRNSAAHPSTVNIGQLQAEEFIDDIVKNVVLKIV